MAPKKGRPLKHHRGLESVAQVRVLRRSKGSHWIVFEMLDRRYVLLIGR